MVVPGQSVNVCNPLTSRWEAEKVSDVLAHRSIEVDLEKGSHVRRNRVDIRESSVSRQPGATVSSPVRTREEPYPCLPMSLKLGPRWTVRTRLEVAEL